MAYVINKYNTSVLTVVEDYTVDNETIDLKLIGRHYVDYGEIQNENFLFLLENFSSSTPPDRPISGQLWFDAYANKLNVFDGDAFVTVGKPHVSSLEPANLTQGELWWDSSNEILKVWDGIGYTNIGPPTNPYQDIPFFWDTDSKTLYVNEDSPTGTVSTKVGPELDEFMALTHILG